MKRAQGAAPVCAPAACAPRAGVGWYSDKRRAVDCLTGLRGLYEQRALCDVTLCAGAGQQVWCHRAVLAASSEYFRAMFTSHFVERTSATVTLTHVSPDCLRRITDYFYTGDAHIDGATVQPLFDAAHMLQVAPLEEACVAYMRANVNETNCIGVYFFAVEYKKAVLKSAARLKICRKFTSVTTGAEYLGLSAAEAAEVLSFSALHRACEEDVYLAAMRWLGHDPEGRRPHLATLLRPVRFALMDEDFFRRRVKHSAQFRGNRALQSVFEQVVYYMNHPNRWHEVDLVMEPRSFGADRGEARWRRAIAYTVSTPAGQTDIEVYSGGLHPVGAMEAFPPQLHRPALVAVAGTSDLYLAGGRGSSSKVVMRLVHGVQFVTMAPMNHSRSQFSFVQVDRFLYVLGGVHKGHLLNSVEKYDLDKNQWTKVAMVPFKLRCACAVSYRGRLYVFGGEAQPKRQGHRILSAHTFCFDPETDKWRTLRSMPTPRALAACAIYKAKIYVIGGMTELSESWQKQETPGGCSRVCEVFSPGLNAWTSGPALPHPLCAAGAVKYYGAIFVLGGIGADGRPSHDVLRLSADGTEWLTETCRLQWAAGVGAVSGVTPSVFSSYAPVTFAPCDPRHSDTESESTTHDLRELDDLGLHQNDLDLTSSSSDTSDMYSLRSWLDTSDSTSSSSNDDEVF